MKDLLRCPECGQKYRIEERFAGKTLKCRKCQTPILVPTLTLAGTVAATSDPTTHDGSSLKPLQNDSNDRSTRPPVLSALENQQSGQVVIANNVDTASLDKGSKRLFYLAVYLRPPEQRQ